MKKKLTAILAILLASVLTLGLVVSGCPGESEQNSEQNGVALGKITSVPMDSTQSPQVGELAPDFYFETPEGESTSLSDFQGTPVLLNFWATWCNPCVHEMPFLQQIYDERPGEEPVLLAINIGESPSQAAEFMQSYGFSFPVLLDGDTALAQRYNIQYIPTTLFINSDGIIQEIKVGSFQSKAEIEAILGQLD